ncbi:hypothetical protein [Gordonia sp. WA4-43]|uniref:hypothetical protein n=1 Tax=Gordonia sp. WA4-43 TaxID=2878678 RepID=UPI001CFA80C6|nr:hypothetical protein [Gordonia sp. WA4-43]UCZ89041.1 hypothetical protein LEL84_18580 [Gordonia sp. WA4-43]
MTAPNLKQIIAEHRYREDIGRDCECGYATDGVNFTADWATHVVAAIRDSGYTVIALPEATYGDGTRIAFAYSEPRRADISCTRCLREIEAYGQLVHRGLVAGHAWRHVDDKSTTCLSLYPTGNCRPYDDYDADRMLAERNTQ